MRLRGPTPESLFPEAAVTLAELLDQGPTPAADRITRTVRLTATDRAALLVDWLNELIYLAEAERLLPETVGPVVLNGLALDARVSGPVLSTSPSFVKAATLHGATFQQREGEWIAEVVFDI